MQKLAMAPGPIRRIHVSRAGDFGRVQLEAADYDRPWFGQVVVARDFGQRWKRGFRSCRACAVIGRCGSWDWARWWTATAGAGG